MAHALSRISCASPSRWSLKRTQVDAAEERGVEDVVDDLAVAAEIERVLQRLEARAAIGAQDDDLAVKPGAVELEALQRAGEVRQALGPVLAAPREKARVAL